MINDSKDLLMPPYRVDIACWIIDAKCNMKQSTLVNTWMRYDLEYFPHTSPVVDVLLVVNVPMGEDVTNKIGDMEVGSDDDSRAVVSV